MNGKIKNINIALTNKCNLKCIMCDIWKEKPKIDIPLDNVKKIFQSKCLDKNVDIALTGGETFLHKDLFDITRIIMKNNPDSLKTISTNGCLTESIMEYLTEFTSVLPKDFSLHISLDGIGTHDLQRGRSLNDILRTIKSVKTNFPFVNIKIKFTITPLNCSDLLSTYNFCKDNSLDFRIKLVEYAKNYTNKIDKKEFKFDSIEEKKIVKDLLQIYKEKVRSDRENAEFIKNTIKFLLNKASLSLCKTPSERIFVMPNGDVYSCIHFDKMGDLNENSLDEIWRSEKANFIRNYIKKNKCNKCMSYHGLSY